MTQFVLPVPTRPHSNAHSFRCTSGNVIRCRSWSEQLEYCTVEFTNTIRDVPEEAADAKTLNGEPTRQWAGVAQRFDDSPPNRTALDLQKIQFCDRWIPAMTTSSRFLLVDPRFSARQSRV